MFLNLNLLCLRIERQENCRVHLFCILSVGVKRLDDGKVFTMCPKTVSSSGLGAQYSAQVLQFQRILSSTRSEDRRSKDEVTRPERCPHAGPKKVKGLTHNESQACFWFVKVFEGKSETC